MPPTTDKELLYRFTNDVLFKMFFVRNPKLLKRLVAVFLGIPLKSIRGFQVTNTEMPPEEIGKKFCRLDISMIVSRQRVNLEIEVQDRGNFKERSLFHWAKLFTSALPTGDNYSLLPRTIVISILGFSLFECLEFRSEFQPMEIERHESFSDKMRMMFFELPKLAGIDSNENPCELDLWLALFNARTEEELARLEKKGGNVMSRAVEAYHNIAVSEEFRQLERLREKTRYDEAQALFDAGRRGERRGEKRSDDRWQRAVADKDVLIADKDNLIADKNSLIADKDSLIAELQAKLKHFNPN